MSARAFFSYCVILFAFAVAGCSPHIGDKCVLNTDCSVTGNLQCDTSMPGGYCTQFNCGPNSCPNGDACYLFHAEVQGCPYNDREPSRTAHSFCMEDCTQNSDCRYGYSCADLRLPPWNAILLDDNQDQPACAPNLDLSFISSIPGEDAGVAPICDPNGDYDAQFPNEPSEDAGGSDGGVNAGAPVNAGTDATLDAGIDATLTDSGAPDTGAADATLD